MERLVAQHCHDLGGYGYSYSPGVIAYFGYGVWGATCGVLVMPREPRGDVLATLDWPAIELPKGWRPS